MEKNKRRVLKFAAAGVVIIVVGIAFIFCKDCRRQADKNPQAVALNKAELDKYFEDLPALLAQASAVPQLAAGGDGRVEGFRILNISKGSIFEKIGLHNDDLIKDVNGVSLASPENALNIYEQFKKDGSFKIKVERNGKDQILTINIR